MCKNTGCLNETKNSNKYCSMTCRNIFVNKNIRNYDYRKIEVQKKQEVYYASPNICQHCKSILPYSKRNHTGCSVSCRISISNTNRKDSENTKIKKREKAILYNLSIGKELNIECKMCRTPIWKRLRKKFCSPVCKRLFNRSGTPAFVQYKADTMFRFSVKDYPNEFDLDLIKSHGWYSPYNSKRKNLNGISRDHMLSVSDGFRLGISPEILSHPANCKLMIHTENIIKNKKSSIGIEALIQRIECWNKKYRRITQPGQSTELILPESKVQIFLRLLKDCVAQWPEWEAVNFRVGSSNLPTVANNKVC